MEQFHLTAIINYFMVRLQRLHKRAARQRNNEANIPSSRTTAVGHPVSRPPGSEGGQVTPPIPPMATGLASIYIPYTSMGGEEADREVCYQQCMIYPVYTDDFKPVTNQLMK